MRHTPKEQSSETNLFGHFQSRLAHFRSLRSSTDRDVTGVLRRAVFFDRLNSWIRYSLGRPFSLCLIELNDPQSIYENHGSLAFARVMLTLGKLLNSRFGLADMRGRYLDACFIVAFPGMAAAQCRAEVQALLSEIEAMEFRSDEPFSVSCSAGLSQYPSDEDSLNNLCKTAERKLWLASRQGKGQLCL